MSESCLEMQKKGSKKASVNTGMLLYLLFAFLDGFELLLENNRYELLAVVIITNLNCFQCNFLQAINEASCTTTASVRITTKLRRKGWL